MSHSNSNDLIALVGRILLCWIFIRAGYGKVFAIEGFADAMTKRGLPAPWAFPYLAILIELVGGVLLVVGFMVRPLSLLLILFVIAATAIAHQYWDYPPDQQVNQGNHFYKNVAIIGGLLLLYVTGGGRYALDALRGRQPATT